MVEQELKIGFRFHGNSLWGKRVAQIMQCFILFFIGWRRSAVVQVFAAWIGVSLKKNWGELNFLNVTDQRRWKFRAYYILHKDFNNFSRNKKGTGEKLLSAFSLVLHCLRFWQDMDKQSIVQSHIWKCYVLKAQTLKTFARDKDKKWNQFQS